MKMAENGCRRPARVSKNRCVSLQSLPPKQPMRCPSCAAAVSHPNRKGCSSLPRAALPYNREVRLQQQAHALSSADQRQAAPSGWTPHLFLSIASILRVREKSTSRPAPAGLSNPAATPDLTIREEREVVDLRTIRTYPSMVAGPVTWPTKTDRRRMYG